MREPIGYKSWSEMSPPFTPDNTVRDNYPPSYFNSMKNSLEIPSEREALITVISSLIKDNQTLKTENSMLRSELRSQQANPAEKPKQVFRSSSSKAQEEQYHLNRILRICKFCSTVHQWGKSRCPKFKKELDKNSKFIFSKKITKARNSTDEKSSDGEKKQAKSIGFPDNRSDASPDQSNSNESLIHLFKHHSSSHAENQSLVRAELLKIGNRSKWKAVKDNATALTSMNKKSISSKDTFGTELLDGQAIDEENVKQAKKPRLRGRNRRKRSMINVRKEMPHPTKPVYSNKVKLKALKTRQECIEIMGWTRHSTYEKEYKENKMKIKTLQEKKCNIMI